MPRNLRQRPFILAIASLAIATGTATACAAQAPQSATEVTSHSASAGDLLGHHSDCGKGGEGGEGGKGGEPGQPGEPGKPGCFRFSDLLPDQLEGSKLSGSDKMRIVMSVMSGHTTSAEAAEKYEVSEDEIDDWKRQFLDGDWGKLFGENGEGTFPFCS
ncbi:helix-turn-helix domain-containing protein [Streptomyces sp. F001]|uniref:helix-turn-helix domain-containing protein n=1 Tax=Streptomyces sp. F001 TaxID=1510026 RepID=UPI00101E3193|nr:helix-turn-helix domain-containing protein [Streptomyces sp. F001]RZB13639.1 helix-turn-helix domain-containing protein [Streptomyces sp. F001]